MSETKDAAPVRIPPPAVYATGIVAGIVLQRLAPVRLGLSVAVRLALAALPAVAATLLVGSAVKRFRATGQDEKPWTPTPSVISSGSYARTRNPMYVSLTLLQVAAGIALGNLWILALAPASMGGVWLVAIRHEEAYLERKFGAEYTDYKQRVRRWL